MAENGGRARETAEGVVRLKGAVEDNVVYRGHDGPRGCTRPLRPVGGIRADAQWATENIELEGVLLPVFPRQ